MAIRMRCPECRKKLRMATKYAGRRVRCSQCQAAFSVPELPGSAKAAVVSERSPERVSRSKKRRKTKEAEYEAVSVKSGFNIDHDELIDMTAMVDIVFFLLIFFLVTSMHALDSAIAMPNPGTQRPQQQQAAAGGASEPNSLEQFEDNDEYIVVQIDHNDRIEVDGIRLKDVEDLVHRIRDLHAVPPHPNKMLVVGHGAATHGTLVAVLDAARDAGLERVATSIRDAFDD